MLYGSEEQLLEGRKVEYGRAGYTAGDQALKSHNISGRLLTSDYAQSQHQKDAALFDAVLIGREVDVAAALLSGANVNALNRRGEFAIHLAIGLRDLDGMLYAQSDMNTHYERENSTIPRRIRGGLSTRSYCCQAALCRGEYYGKRF